MTGTVQFPVAKLVSEPNVPDNEKLSWLLFGHGTDQGNNLGQQSTMTTALALLGSASGKPDCADLRARRVFDWTQRSGAHLIRRW